MDSWWHMLNLEMEENVLNWDSRGSNSSPKLVIDFVPLNFPVHQFAQHNSKGIETDDLYDP